MALGSTTREQPPVAEWALPIKGVVQGVRDIGLPPDALFNASNADFVDGVIRGRFGLTQLSGQLFSATPVGALNFWDSSTSDFVVLVTTNKVWTLQISTLTWTDRGGTLTGTIDNPGRITEFGFGTPFVNRAYICNGVDAFKFWKVGDTTVTNVPGSPPIFKDITTVADRLVGLVSSHEVRWSEPLSDATWNILASRQLTETPSPTVACRNIGTLGVAIYKMDSIWVGEITGLAGGNSFRFSLVDQIEGPAGPNALVDAAGVHVYMTRDGRIGLFNGLSHKWIGDSVWKIVKAEIDSTKPFRIHGVYLPSQHQCRFYYQRTGQTVTDGLVTVNLQAKTVDLPFSLWPGRMGKSITAGCALLSSGNGPALIFANNTGAEKAYKIETANPANDDGVAVSSNIQTGLIVPTKLEVARALALEAWLERGGGFGSMTAKLVSSNILSDINGTLSAGSTIDLTQTPIKSPIGFDTRGRFLGLRFEWDSTAKVNYRGAILRAAEGL